MFKEKEKEALGKRRLDRGTYINFFEPSAVQPAATIRWLFYPLDSIVFLLVQAP